MIVFNVDPVGKPRMTQSDRWNTRKPVADYLLFKDILNIQAKRLKYKVGDTLGIIFYLPMPSSWSKAKKKKMFKTPHQQTPDIDNLVKAFLDALVPQDCHIYSLFAVKVWANKGVIGVFEAG